MLASLALLRFTLFSAWLGVVVLPCRQVCAEEAVLLASTVSGYAPGMVVSDHDRLNIPEGASATLLFQSGEILRLGGPFDGALERQVSHERQGGIAALADMFRARGVDATVIGGTRRINASRPAALIEDVEVDASRSGTYCIQQTTSVWIMRPSGDRRTVSVRRNGSRRTLQWAADAERVEWPADVPIDDGSQFDIAMDGAASARITFRTLSGGEGPGIASGIASGVAQGIARGITLGCHDQFGSALHHMVQATASPEIWMTTDRGRHPTFRPDDPLTLTVVPNMDGYLYCVAIAQNGSTTPLFPAGAMDGSQMHGSVALTVPGHRQHMTLRAGSIVHQARCWLADRDITPELPHALIEAPSVRIPDQLATQLDTVFSRLQGTRIGSDTLTVRVE